MTLKSGHVQDRVGFSSSEPGITSQQRFIWDFHQKLIKSFFENVNIRICERSGAFLKYFKQFNTVIRHGSIMLGRNDFTEVRKPSISDMIPLFHTTIDVWYKVF